MNTFFTSFVMCILWVVFLIIGTIVKRKNERLGEFLQSVSVSFVFLMIGGMVLKPFMYGLALLSFIVFLIHFFTWKDEPNLYP